jgi:hypothetical protein
MCREVAPARFTPRMPAIPLYPERRIPTLAQAVDLSPATLFYPPANDWRSRSLCSELPIGRAAESSGKSLSLARLGSHAVIYGL